MTFPENFSHNTIFLVIGLFYGIREIFWQFLKIFEKFRSTSCNLLFNFWDFHLFIDLLPVITVVMTVVIVMTFSWRVQS